MSNYVDIHTQLASFMDVLAKSAITKIGKMIDSDSLGLKLEISRSKQEIAALKRKLQFAESELRITRKTVMYSKSCGNCRSVGIQVCEETPLNKRPIRLLRNGDIKSVVIEDPSLLSQSMTNELAEMVDDGPELVVIKEENQEEAVWTNCPQAKPKIHREECSSEARAEPYKVTSQAHDTDGGDTGQLVEPEFPVKDEQDTECVRLRADGLNLPPSASDFSMDGRESQLRDCGAERNLDIRDAGPESSDRRGRYSHPVTTHPHLSLQTVKGPSTKPHGSVLRSTFKNPFVMLHMKLNKEPNRVQSDLSEKTKVPHKGAGQERALSPMLGGSLISQPARGQRPPVVSNVHAQRKYASASGSDHSKTSTLTKAQGRVCKGQKQSRCARCGKSFTTRFYLKIHERIHTGERPFVCSQCGKGFYCSSHLISHQRSHTGEKPYSCEECGTSYSHLNSLKLHQKVHEEERTFT